MSACLLSLCEGNDREARATLGLGGKVFNLSQLWLPSPWKGDASGELA